MLDEEFVLAPLEVAGATKLFHLQLRGAGTGNIESLFSYLLALAEAHSVAASQLVNYVLPDLAAFKDTNACLGWGWDREGGAPMIGRGETAARWARVLEEATGRQDLRYATLHALRRHASGEQLVEGLERVCVECIQEDLANGLRPYGRLLWRMQSVKCCPDHGTALVPTRCAVHPERRRGPATFRTRKAGHCLKCGAVGFSCVLRSEETVTEADVFRARACREVIAALPQIDAVDPVQMKDKLIAHCSRTGGRTSLSRRVGAVKSSISRWLNLPEACISFGQLADIAIHEGFELADMLRGDLGQTYQELDRTPVRVARSYQYRDHRRIELELERALREGASISSVAELLDVDATTLARHEALYRAVVDQSRNAREAALREHRAEAVREAADIVRRAVYQGRRPSLQFARSVTGEAWRLSQLKAMALVLLRVELKDPDVWKPSRTSVCSDEFLAEVRRVAGNLASELRAEPLLQAA